MKHNTIAAKLFNAQVAIDNALGNAAISRALVLFSYDEKKFGVNKAKLSAGQASVREVQTLLKAQRTEKGEAQAATKARDEALEALMDWLGDFIAQSLESPWKRIHSCWRCRGSSLKVEEFFSSDRLCKY